MTSTIKIAGMVGLALAAVYMAARIKKIAKELITPCEECEGGHSGKSHLLVKGEPGFTYPRPIFSVI
jgi:hypothetical protein